MEKKKEKKYEAHLGLYHITDKQLGAVRRRLGELAKVPAPHILAARNRKVLDSLKEPIAAALEQGYGEGVIHDIFVSQGVDVSVSVIRNYICQLRHGKSYSTWSGSDARKRAAKNAKKKEEKEEKEESPKRTAAPAPQFPESPETEKTTEATPETPKKHSSAEPAAPTATARTDEPPAPEVKPEATESAKPDETPERPVAAPEIVVLPPKEMKPTSAPEQSAAAEPVAATGTDGTEMLTFSDGFESMRIDAGPIRFYGSPVVYEFLSGSVRRMGVYDCPIAGAGGTRSWSFRTTEGVAFRVFEQDLRNGTCRAARKDLRRC